VSTVEDRIREALRADAETVRPEAIRQLHDPRPRAAASPRRPRSRLTRRLIPLAAPAAVVGIAVAGALLGSGTADHPPFLVGVGSGSEITGLPSRDLGVYSAATGRLVARLAPRREGYVFRATAATADSRTFIVAAMTENRACNSYLYRLRLSTSGQVAGLTALTVPEVSGSVWNLSASANGSIVAYTAEPCRGNTSRASVGVLNLATGKARTWPVVPSDQSNPITSISLSGSGGRLAFIDHSFRKGASVRVLATDAAPGPVDQRSRAVLSPAARAAVAADGGVSLSPSGTELLTCFGDPPNSYNYRIVVFGVAAGDPLEEFQVRYHSDIAPCGVSLDPAGRWLLVTGIFPLLHGRPSPVFPRGRPYAGARFDLATGHATLFGNWPGGMHPLSISW
jgi:hypothetical protein